ncbi:Aldo/keto reductase, partial [Aureobasidium melanogenum]
MANVGIGLDSVSVNTLRQSNIPMLKTPSDHQLGPCTIILFGQRDDSRMILAQGPCERRIGFNQDTIFATRFDDIRARVERVHFDLIDSGLNTRLRRHQLVQMLDAEIAHAADFHLAVLDGVFNGFPGSKAGLFSPIGAVQEEQIYVSESTAGGVGCELGSEEDVFAFDGRVVGQKGLDCLSAFALVAVHLGAVDASVAGFEGILDGGFGFAGPALVRTSNTMLWCDATVQSVKYQLRTQTPLSTVHQNSRQYLQKPFHQSAGLTTYTLNFTIVVLNVISRRARIVCYPCFAFHWNTKPDVQRRKTKS